MAVGTHVGVDGELVAAGPRQAVPTGLLGGGLRKSVGSLRYSVKRGEKRRRRRRRRDLWCGTNGNALWRFCLGLGGRLCGVSGAGDGTSDVAAKGRSRKKCS